MSRGMPKNARKLEELLAQREQWEIEAQNLFLATRAETGMTQSAFAASIDTSQSYVNEIEHGQKTPSSGTLMKLRSIWEVDSGDTDQDNKDKATDEA